MTVAVLFGGKSCEHNVSVVTGVQALARFPKEHKAVPVYIDERGGRRRPTYIPRTAKSFARSIVFCCATTA